MEGDFLALDAATGKLLWHFQTGGAVWASPISFTSEGKQYITVASGSSILTFGL
jgi:alcohol dehydrogenase (cytochrome c)